MSTPAYCNKCQINWANLWNDNHRHGIGFCPCCKTDSFLTDPIDSESYLRSEITGAIINVQTKKVYTPSNSQNSILKENVDFDIKAWEARKEAEQEKQLAAIAKYHEVYNSHGPEIAEQLYFKVLKQK